MKIILSVIAFALFFVQTIQAQGVLDSVYPGFVLIDEIVFNDSVERQLFESDFSTLNNRQRLELLMRTESAQMEVPTKKWEELVASLKEIKKAKKNEKYIKSIYKQVHGFLLRKYEIETTFDKIFDDGVYNCVTASGLYALVFEELGVPYEIKELPSHVYVIAYPDEKILVETTDPNSGFFAIDSDFKTEFVNNLVTNKLISSNELNTQSLDELFDEHYFKDKIIDFKKLLGIQYLNQGIYLMQANQYRKAIEHLEKACYLYPSGACVANLFVCMAKLIDESDYKNDRDIMFLARLTRLPDEFELSDSEILGTFGIITNKLLIETGQKVRYDTIYAQLSRLITENDSLLGQLSLIYNYETSRYHILAGNEGESLPYAIAALKMEPTNLQTQAVVIDVYRQRFVKQYQKGTVDSQVLNELIELKEEIPELWNNGNYKNLYINFQLALIGLQMDDNKYDQALNGLSDLDLLIKEAEVEPTQQMVSSVCGQMAKYYFKKGQYANARKATSFGLNMYPNDPLLKTIKSQLR